LFRANGIGRKGSVGPGVKPPSRDEIGLLDSTDPGSLQAEIRRINILLTETRNSPQLQSIWKEGDGLIIKAIAAKRWPRQQTGSGQPPRDPAKLERDRSA